MEANEDEHLLDEKRGRSGLSCRLAFAFSACTIGSSFQFGYNTGVVNAPEKVIETFLNASSYYHTHVYVGSERIALWWACIVSIWIVGGMIGCLTGGPMADRFGRKGYLLLSNMFVIIGGLLMFGSKYAQSGIMLFIGRFITGIHSGVSTTVAPMYLSEIAPLNWRGFAGTLNQLITVVGILVSQVLGLETILGNEKYWHILLGFVLVPAVMQLIVLPCCPESPRYTLLKKQKKDKAFLDLIWFHGDVRANQELKEIIMEGESTQCLEKVSLWQLLKQPTLRTAVFVSIVLQMSQQLTGINAVMYYSTSIFENSGFAHSVAQYATMGTSIVNLLMTCISAILVDLAGRRTLQLVGLGGEGIFAILITIGLVSTAATPSMKYLSIVAIFGFVIAFAVGPGSIPWFMVSEMFPLSQRGAAVSVSAFMNWFSNFIVGLSFPPIQNAIGAYSFVPFIAVTILVWTYLYLRLPETKNRSVAEITAQLSS